MFGADAILPAFLILLACCGIAFAALAGLFCGIWFWREKRDLSLAFLIPSALYLFLFFYFFTPRPLPHHVLTIDLRKPVDLSGIPDKTLWFSSVSPPPTFPIDPLSASGSNCCVEGDVDLSITLPDGQILHDKGREVYIDTDETGIYKILIDSGRVKPIVALERLKPYIWPLTSGATNEASVAQNLPEIQNGLSSYVPESKFAAGVRLIYPTYKFDLMLGSTSVPSDKVSYFCLVRLPHEKK
jgi:hypothetical protein